MKGASAVRERAVSHWGPVVLLGLSGLLLLVLVIAVPLGWVSDRLAWVLFGLAAVCLLLGAMWGAVHRRARPHD